jgi:hypothetical protein
VHLGKEVQSRVNLQALEDVIGENPPKSGEGRTGAKVERCFDLRQLL